ncbi:MAG: hypothetical protein R2731_12125 [Nocardioides sp.]
MTDTLISDTVTSIAPLEVREQFMTDPRPRCRQLPGLRDGREPAPVGAVRLQSAPSTTAARLAQGRLEDLVRLRDRAARWYHANGVRPGDPVGVVIAEGLPPLVHFLALSALGAVPALVNDAMRPDIMVRSRPRGRGRRGRRHHPALDGLPSGPRTARPRFVALTSEVEAGNPDLGELPQDYPHRHAARRRRGTHPLLRHDRHPEVDARSPAVLGGRSRGWCASRPSPTTG